MDYYSERVIVLERSLGSDTNSKRLGELIHNIADGDRGALAELYKLTNKDVYAFALSILKNIHDAEDVLQDCFVRIYSSAGSYSDRGKPMAWILTITKNLCLKCIRSSQRRVSLFDKEWSFSPPDEFESSADDRIMLSKLEIEMDHEHGVMIYEVSFVYNDYKYNYDIDACNGAVLEAKSNPIDDKGKDEKDKSDNKDKLPGDNEQDGSLNNSVTTSNNETGISSDRAKEIAFSNAGVSSESAVSKLEIETDQEHGTIIYEVSFFYNDSKYNYDIDAYTGAITETKISPVEDKGNSESKSNDKEQKPSKSDKDNEKNPDPNSESFIGETAAKAAALYRAGLNAGDITEYKCETYIQKGTSVYKIKFISGEYEYSCDVDAGSGDIVKFDKQSRH